MGYLTDSFPIVVKLDSVIIGQPADIPGNLPMISAYDSFMFPVMAPDQFADGINKG